MQNWKKLIIAAVFLFALGWFTPIGFFLILALTSFLTSIVAFFVEER